MHRNAYVIAVFLLAMIAGCGGGGGGSTGAAEQASPVAPQVLTASPAPDSFFVDSGSELCFEFNTDIDQDSLSRAFSLVPQLAGSWRYDASLRSACFVADSALAPATHYQAELGSALLSRDGQSMQAAYRVAFYTRGDETATIDHAQRVVVLDLSARNGESDTDLRALTQALAIMGVPYRQTDDVALALDADLIYTASYISTSTLTDDQKAALRSFVSNGGVLVSRDLSDVALFDLYGISGQDRDNTRAQMRWEVEGGDASLGYFEHEREITVSFGGGSYSSFINTRGYTAATAEALARFVDSSMAVAKNHYGNGVTYLLGVSFSDVILRNQMDLDYSADRGALNEYEPTTDTFLLFLRSICQSHIPYANWKHTSTGDSEAALIISHDVDSQSSVDWMPAFAELEQSYGVSASYNINTHYIDDAIDGDFFSMNIDVFRAVQARGHAIASHSVGHFPDWDREDIIPVGVPGNTMQSYQPGYDGSVTAGATVYGELEVSRDLLRDNLGSEVHSFRSGHLLWNDAQVGVMEALGYRFDSSFSANNVLSNFPYRLLYRRQLSAAHSPIYEFALNSSDSISGEQVPAQTAALWLDTLNNNRANGALTVLLIHPNRDYKLEELRALLQRLPDNVAVQNMDSFGEFWRARDQWHYSAALTDNRLRLSVDQASLPLDPRLAIVIKDGLQLAAVELVSTEGQAMTGRFAVNARGDLIVYQLR